MRMDLDIKEVGKMIYSMVMDYKNGLKVVVIKDNISREKNMVKDNINGLTELNTLEIGYKII